MVEEDVGRVTAGFCVRESEFVLISCRFYEVFEGFVGACPRCGQGDVFLGEFFFHFRGVLFLQ